MNDSIRERIRRIQRLLHGDEQERLYTESSGKDVVLVNLEGDCGLFASSDGIVEIQTRRAGVAVSEEVVAVVAQYVVMDSDGGLHLLVPKHRIFIMDRQLDESTVDGRQYVVPAHEHSLQMMFKDEKDQPVPFSSVFGLHQVFHPLPPESPTRKMIDELENLHKHTGGTR